MRVRHLLSVCAGLGVLVAAGCTPPPAGHHAPPPPPPPPCIHAKTDTSPPFPFSSLYFQWNGVVGDGINITSYTDSDCTIPATAPDYFGVAATVLSPAPPVPAPYTSWSDVPYSQTPAWFGTDEQAAAITACQNLFGDVGSAVVFANLGPDTVTVAGSLPDNLWECAAVDFSVSPPVLTRPV